VPVWRDSSRSLVKVRLGLRLYDWLAPGRDRERSRVLRPVDALSLEPAIRAEDLRGAGYYLDDLLLSPERLCLENVLSACRHGARAFNYALVEAVVRDGRGRLAGVRVRDLLGDRVATLGARVVVNATGPWVDAFRALAGTAERGRRILRRTKGIHCLLPRMTERAVYHGTRDERMIFVIPWREFSLVGTTDTDFDGDPDRVHATGDEVRYLLDEVRRALPDPRVRLDQVAYTYAGVRPLSFEEGGRASDVSRAHRVVAEERGRLLSITGTKLTCFRSLAASVGDQIARALGRRAPGRTHLLALDGTDGAVDRVEARVWMDVTEEAAASGLPRESLEALVATYGRAWRRVVELAGKLPGGGERLCPGNPEIVAQLHVAVEEELAVSLQDVLLRRTGIGTSACQGLDCAEAIAQRMARLAGWSPRRLAAELEAYQAHVARSRRFRG
jgi:glycerol-3-phosphate dehydrogenase